MKKIPMRQCMGCREHRPKRELIRVVRMPETTPSGTAQTTPQVVLDFKGKVNGRGAYICSELNCLKRVRKSGALNRMLGVTIPPEVWEELECQITTKSSDS